MSDQRTVFISYRRNVSSFIARAIFLDLKAHDYDVFMDVESLDSGQFDQIILAQIAARAHFLIILTPGTLEGCADAGDWVRREIEQAIDLERNIVPILVNNFDFHAYREYLTGTLEKLPLHSGLNVPHDYFDEAMERLRTRFLKQPVKGGIVATSSSDERIVQRLIDLAASQPAPTPKQLSAEEYARRGYSKQSRGELAKAIADYNEAIRLDPTDAKTYYYRGCARYQRGDLAEAMVDFDEAIRLDPNNAKAYHDRGAVRYSQGDLAGAVADYSEAIRLKPKYAQAYYSRGSAYLTQGNLEGAIEDFTMSIPFILNNPAYAYDARGETYFALGQYQHALADFEEALRLEPAHKYAKVGLPLSLYALGQLDESRHQWQVLIFEDERYRDADWVGKELKWRPELVDAAARLIASL